MGLLDEETLDEILSPANLMRPHYSGHLYKSDDDVTRQVDAR